MTHKHRKKLINFIFWGAGCSLLRAKVFSCSLDISKLQFFDHKNFSICFFFFSFWSSKPWIRVGSVSGSGFTWNAGFRSGFFADMESKSLTTTSLMIADLMGLYEPRMVLSSAFLTMILMVQSRNTSTYTTEIMKWFDNCHSWTRIICKRKSGTCCCNLFIWTEPKCSMTVLENEIK